ncbi:MAG: gamma-glutamyltransferase family protein [Caulobacteraceae bacterium]
MRPTVRMLLAFLACAALSAPAAAQPQIAPAAYRHAIVVAAEPDAAEAGLKVLRGGGNAIDAAVAVQAVLGLEEPQSSGLGGGAFMLYYDAATHRTIAYNGREKAPAADNPDLFLGPDGKPMSFIEAMVSGRSTGAPGAIAMLALAHREHGRRPWSSLFSDAERLALQGFVVPKRMGAAMNLAILPQDHTPDALAYFTKPGGDRFKAGEVMRNPAYAASLALIARDGPAALDEGRIAADIVSKVHQPPLPGALTLADLQEYRAEQGPALCRPYHSVVVCAPPPPAGGVGVLELLGILAHSPFERAPPQSPEAWFDFVQASRLMYADRDYYVADPDFVSVPVKGLLDPAYEASRARLIGKTATPKPGHPAGAEPWGEDSTVEPGGTTHFVIVDQFGDVVSMTTTVNLIFGNGRLVDGFFLNDQLTDFARDPRGPNGALAANAPAGGKRPRSSMSPLIVFDRHGRVLAAFGSPGGNAIIAFVAKAAVGLLDWKMTLQQAVDLPNMVGRGSTVAVEKGVDPSLLAALRAKGLEIKVSPYENSGLVGMVATRSGYVGAVDPRREAVALGF